MCPRTPKGALPIDKRVSVAIDKMSKGTRRPCCFDRSGMYDKSLAAPVAEEE